MFNDPIAMLFLHLCMLLLMERKTVLAVLSFSLALSVKMNILLYLPGLLLIIQLSYGTLGTILCVVTLTAFQGVFSLPFTLVDTHAYLAGAFDFSR